MRIPWLLLAIFLLLNLSTDYYIYNVAKNRLKNRLLKNIQLYSAIFLYVFIIVTLCIPRRSGEDGDLIVVMWLLFIYFSIYIAKYLFVLFDLFARIPTLWKRHRIKWLSITGCVVAGIVFLSMWWGALINRFRIEVKEVSVNIPSLPSEFEGFTILQFSDFHTGTYGDNTKFVEEVVNKINSLHPDLIVFTGDIVNRRSSELRPFVSTLSKLQAPYGIYAILGNHDYGDYSEWSSPAAKQQNMEQLYRMNTEMGWRLLRNETAWIKKGNDSIALIGVENIGDPPFPVYGSLAKAYPQISDDNVKILLTHNPAHWVDEVSKNDTINVSLTLSGHTHAMQITILGMSPAKFRYPTWGSLYYADDNKKLLYVNIGLGTVGVPMRIGATPELTLITLHSNGR